jgi:hypothetical protein
MIDFIVWNGISTAFHLASLSASLWKGRPPALCADITATFAKRAMSIEPRTPSVVAGYSRTQNTAVTGAGTRCTVVTRRDLSYPEQVGVVAGSNKDQGLIRHSVEEEPVGLHVAVPMSGPNSAQGMRTAPRGQWLPTLKNVYNRLQFVQILALFVDTPRIPLKSGCRAEIESRQIRSRSSRNER